MTQNSFFAYPKIPKSDFSKNVFFYIKSRTSIPLGGPYICQELASKERRAPNHFQGKDPKHNSMKMWNQWMEAIFRNRMSPDPTKDHTHEQREKHNNRDKMTPPVHISSIVFSLQFMGDDLSGNIKYQYLISMKYIPKRPLID